MITAAVYARKSIDQNTPRRGKVRHPPGGAREGLRHAQGLDRRRRVRICGRRDLGRRVPQAPRLPRPHERAAPSAPFQVLITMEQSRLGPSLDEVPYALKRITDAGVRVWCYLTDTEVKRESAADKFMVHAIAFVDDMHREQSPERTRDALRRKAERGHVVGGMVYGYRNVRAEGHVERAIEAAEAEVVRRIYQETGRGLGYLRIARRLNADGIVGPRGLPWAASTIRAMLFRDL
jgi:DNA invertase Pin-like site-specific DNA recombinase